MVKRWPYFLPNLFICLNCFLMLNFFSSHLCSIMSCDALPWLLALPTWWLPLELEVHIQKPSQSSDSRLDVFWHSSCNFSRISTDDSGIEKLSALLLEFPESKISSSFEVSCEELSMELVSFITPWLPVMESKYFIFETVSGGLPPSLQCFWTLFLDDIALFCYQCRIFELPESFLQQTFFLRRLCAKRIYQIYPN